MRITEVGFNITMLSHIRELLKKYAKMFIQEYFANEERVERKFTQFLENLYETEV